MKSVDVVAGIVFSQTGDRVLLALRKPEQHQGNCWEFPGGKIEKGESIEAGLVRELQEEIGITVTRSQARTCIEHRYPDKQVRLYFHDVLSYEGEPLGREGQRLEWFHLHALGELDFPAANLSVVAQLRSIVQGN